MNTFEELNGYGNTTVTYIDSRAYGVIFNKPTSITLSQSFTSTQKVFTALLPIDIEEIIDPTNANVRFKFEIVGLENSVDFGTLPPGVTVSQSGTVYTVFGIDSLDDWNSVKQPTVTIDDDYFGDFTYSGTIIYNTPTANNIEVTYDVGIFVPVALLEGEFNYSITPTLFKDVEIIMEAFTFSISEGIEIQPLQGEASMQSNISISGPDGKRLRGLDGATLLTNAILSVDATVIPTITISELYTKTESTVQTFQSGLAFNDNYWAWGDPYDTSTDPSYRSAIRIYNTSFGGNYTTLFPPSTGIKFGQTMSIDGTTLSIAAPEDGDGKVYQYNLTNLNLIRTITPPVSGLGSGFGFYLDMSSNYTIIGNLTNDDDVYVFNNNDGSLEYTLSISGAKLDTVAITNDYAVCGDPTNNKAYVFNMSDGSLAYTLNNPNYEITDTNDKFGNDVEIDGQYIIIGATTENIGPSSPSQIDGGVVYVFNLNDNASLLHTFVNPSNDNWVFNDNMGLRLSASGSYLICGVPFHDVNPPGDTTNHNRGAVYTYNLITGNLMQSLTGNEDFAGFGWQVGIATNRAIAIDQLDNTTGFPTARVYNITS